MIRNLSAKQIFFQKSLSNLLLSPKNFASNKKKAHPQSKILYQDVSHKWKKGEGLINSNSISVILWNVNGYRSVLKNGNIQQLFALARQSDFICLNQTKIGYQTFLQQEKNNKLKFEQAKYFNECWNFSKVSNGYSGVTTFSKHLPISVVEDMPKFSDHSKEGRILTLEFEKFYLINLYKPTSGGNLEYLSQRIEYQQCFRQFVKQLQQRKPVIIASDMNVANQQIDLKQPKRFKGKVSFTQEQRTKFKQLLHQCNLIDSFRHLNPTKVEYSYWSYQQRSRILNSGWRLDYILVDKKLKVKDAGILTNIQGSDHCPVWAVIQFL